MSIKIKNLELTNDTINSLNILIDTDIDAVCAFRLSRIIKELTSIVEDKNKMEKKIIEKWTQKDETGNIVPVLNESGDVLSGAVNIIDPEAFKMEMDDFMDYENEIEFEKIDFVDLRLKTAKVRDLLKLEFLFN
jgi:hypothetical protein